MILRPREAAQYLGVGVTTLWELVHHAGLRVKYIAPRIPRFAKADLDDFWNSLPYGKWDGEAGARDRSATARTKPAGSLVSVWDPSAGSGSVVLTTVGRGRRRSGSSQRHGNVVAFREANA